jgi:hypothetical protein
MPSPPDSDAGPDPGLTGRILAALNHPLRIRILEALVREPASASTLAEDFRLPLSNVSYHLCKVLADDLDLVEVVERHARRGAQERVFAPRPACFVAMLLTRIADAAAGVAGEGAASLHAPIAVDGEGRHEIEAAVAEFARRVQAVEDRCEGANPAELERLLVGTAAFEAFPTPLERSA